MWMHARSLGNPRLLGNIRDHQPFFERIDAEYSSALDLNGPALLQLFGTGVLRRHLLPVQFLTEELDIHLRSEDKSDASEAARITELLIAAKRQPWNELLQAYHQALMKSALSPRSVRTYLSNAALFCASANVGNEAWPAGRLEHYLEAKPGARNSLSRFITFCRSARGWKVQMPPKGVVVRPLADPVRSARKLRDLISNVEETGIASASQDVLGSILAESLGFPKAVVLSSTATDFQVTLDAVTYFYGKERICIPQELDPYARRFVEMLVK
ncbi:hypothetical protein [Massilia sp. Mn16-1_5]|uniref:hypothetical protein n=1 Tax=Massilia sp. Mn16-1_5 TaxID=2079199 RepID=UPI00109EBD9D|nr:hypothetical protein [Massilia sp. Mn16-1_5]